MEVLIPHAVAFEHDPVLILSHRVTERLLGSFFNTQAERAFGNFTLVDTFHVGECYATFRSVICQGRLINQLSDGRIR